jgi:hypothetical protein
MSLTFADLIARADRALGGRAAVLRALPLSRQRLQSALHGGPPLRAERLVRLAVITGVDVCKTLRATGRTRLADLLDEAYGFRFADATPIQRLILRDLATLPIGVQDALLVLVEALAADQRRETSS